MRDTATVSEDSLDLLGRLATENPPPEADSFATNAAPTLGHLQTREVG